MMPEEVVLLVEQSICVLVHTPSAFHQRVPSRQEIDRQDQARREHVQGLRVATVEATEEKKQAYANKLKMGRGDQVEEKRKARRAAKQSEALETSEEASSLFAPPPPPSTSTTQDLSKLAYFTAVPATPDATPTRQTWFDPSIPGTTLYETLESARQAGIWTYPSTPLERARCATFHHLWSQGMYLGTGSKFGGEFLVYPGDPLRYHSHFVTTSIERADKVIAPMEIVAWGRLGTATKKAHLICCFDEDRDEDEEEDEWVKMNRQEVVEGQAGHKVECYSLEWANFG